MRKVASALFLPFTGDRCVRDLVNARRGETFLGLLELASTRREVSERSSSGRPVLLVFEGDSSRSFFKEHQPKKAKHKKSDHISPESSRASIISAILFDLTDWTTALVLEPWLKSETCSSRMGPSRFPSEKLTERMWPSLWDGVSYLRRLVSLRAELGVLL